jgi:hypothetical protein
VEIVIPGKMCFLEKKKFGWLVVYEEDAFPFINIGYR